MIDTHCHIHEPDYQLDPAAVLDNARAEGVDRVICVGTDSESSRLAVAFAQQQGDAVYSAIGVHPHETSRGVAPMIELAKANPDISAIGEIGLDYFYTHSEPETQRTALEVQLQIAQDYDKPVIFHVRDAFDDFWPIYRNFHVPGVLHSFTDSRENLEKALSEGLYIGVNGISTFTKSAEQQEMFRAIPLERMLLETDAPFLTPTPFRGKVNEPSMVRRVAEFHAADRGVLVESIDAHTTRNAERLFGL